MPRITARVVGDPTSCLPMPADRSLAIKMSEGFTDAEKQVIWKRDRGVCRICLHPVKKQSEEEYHHVLPIELGGAPHDVNNGWLTHKVCHSRNYEVLHGTRLTAQRAAISKRALMHWIFRRKKHGDNDQASGKE